VAIHGVGQAGVGFLVCWASSSTIGAEGRWLQQVAVQSAVSSEVAGLNGAAGEAAAMGLDGGQACRGGKCNADRSRARQSTAR